MENKKLRFKPNILFLVIISSLAISACAPFGVVTQLFDSGLDRSEELVGIQEAEEVSRVELDDETEAPIVTLGSTLSLEGTLQEIYQRVNPGVVNIQVISTAEISLPSEHPEFNSDELPLQQGLGSGFVWDEAGHIVTNNHVVENATEIEVIFHDGRVYDAELVGADPDTDLAVIQIDAPQSELYPITMGNSDEVLVGDLAIAIGNPFGLDGTMTMGIISALGRSLPVDSISLNGTYSIPDIIQTDAAINPGNSGGVLLNAEGEVIGIPTAITSNSQSNAGIGYAVPANIVNNVVPQLIADGSYAHAWVGISGGTLQADIAELMNLDRSTRGILVNTVVPDGPADQAGLEGSDTSAEYEGYTVSIGGDIITAIDGEAITAFEDLVSYLARATRPGQDVELDILRDGKTQTLTLTLGARPSSNETQTPTVVQEESQTNGQAYIGIMGGSLIPEVAEAMDLDVDQEGVLITEVAEDSPAEKAGLIGSDESVEIRGQEIRIGGDVIIAVDRQSIDGIETLRETLQEYIPGDEITLTLLRNGKTINVKVTLSERP